MGIVVITLTYQGQVTSSVTWPFDSLHAISYWWSFGVSIFNRPHTRRKWFLVRLRLCYSVASVCLSVVCTECIVAKRCVLEQKLLLTAYKQSLWEIEIDWYQNEWPWPCLEVVSRSRQPLRHIRCWISRKPSEIEAWFHRTTNRKWLTWYQMVTWPMTSRDPQRCCEAVRSAILATAWLLVYFVACHVLHALDRQ